MLNKLIGQAELAKDFVAESTESQKSMIDKLSKASYLLKDSYPTTLIAPHGGKFVDRMLVEAPAEGYLTGLEKIKLNENLQMDVEQIAIGTFSPLEEFMK